MRNRLEAYAKAFGINTIQEKRTNEKAKAANGSDNFSTTGTVREAFDTLSDGDMLVVPIGGDTDDFE